MPGNCDSTRRCRVCTLRNALKPLYRAKGGVDEDIHHFVHVVHSICFAPRKINCTFAERLDDSLSFVSRRIAYGRIGVGGSDPFHLGQEYSPRNVMTCSGEYILVFVFWDAFVCLSLRVQSLD